MAEFRMPILGANMQAGTLTAWRKRPGDAVRRGDIIAEVETDKANVEVEVFATGTLEEILVDAGAKVPVGTPLAIIREEGAAASGATASAPAPVPSPVAPAPPAARPLVSAGARIRISPSARRLAAHLGVDPSAVRGSGPAGRIMRRDIELAAKEGAAAGPATPTEATGRQERMRRAIAAAMERSAREIPQYQLCSSASPSRSPAVPHSTDGRGGFFFELIERLSAGPRRSEGGQAFHDPTVIGLYRSIEEEEIGADHGLIFEDLTD